jgi:hypothetical protein
VSDLAFEQLLAEFNQSYKDASEFSDWMPDDGDYIVTILKCTKGVSTKNDKKTMWWNLTGRVEAPENEKINGQEFAAGRYNSSAMGILKGQARALNGGTSVSTLAEANKVFEAAVGKVLKMKIATTHKDDGKSYTNCYVKEVLALAEDTGSAGVEPPQQ